MFIARLHKFLTATVDEKSRSHTIFWLTLSLTLAAVYAILGIKQAFSAEYMVQDDARQHVFWMMRFVDPELFPNDFIANYFQSVAPAGYSTLYKFSRNSWHSPAIFSQNIAAISRLNLDLLLFWPLPRNAASADDWIYGIFAVKSAYMDDR